LFHSTGPLQDLGSDN